LPVNDGLTPRTFRDHPRSFNPHGNSQKAVRRGGLTSALQMPEDDVPTFPVRLFFEIACEFLANPA
jgi:hypothetical protein